MDSDNSVNLNAENDLNLEFFKCVNEPEEEVTSATGSGNPGSSK